MKFLFIVFNLGFLIACQYNPGYQIISKNDVLQSVRWTEQEKAQSIAIRNIARTQKTSHHLIRLTGSEKAHIHNKHDLTVTLLTGKSMIHFKDAAIVMKAGDVVLIPAGTYHWAENLDDEASEVFAIFAPAYDGKDKHIIEKVR